MNSTQSPASEGAQITRTIVRQSVENQPGEWTMSQPAPAPKNSGYGLPCAKCRTYFAADQSVCPVCKGTERVSPTLEPRPIATPSSEPIPDTDALEAERERFLREFKSQIYAAHTQIDAVTGIRCSFEGKHADEFAAAAVCKGCFDEVQQRLDVMEAALHMDLKEAAQVIYDAVWADSSDPSKTYQNAAQALLAEVRKRAGLSTVLGPLQPRPH